MRSVPDQGIDRSFSVWKATHSIKRAMIREELKQDEPKPLVNERDPSAAGFLTAFFFFGAGPEGTDVEEDGR